MALNTQLKTVAVDLISYLSLRWYESLRKTRGRERARTDGELG